MVNTSDILPNTPRYLKVPLIFFNAILWILGLLLIILGSVVLNELKDVKGLNINVGLSSGLIVLGVFIIILTIVGSVVAFKEQLVGLIVYTIVMLVLLICLVGVGGAAFSYRDDADTVLNKAWAAEKDGSIKGHLETHFDCCGWNGTDAANATLKSGVQCLLSDSTRNGPYEYFNETSNTTVEFYNYTYFWRINPATSDCKPVISSYVREKLYIAGVAGVVIGVIEFVCMFFSLYLVVRLCRNPRSRSYD